MTQGSEAQDVFRVFLERLSQLWLHTRSRCLLVFDEQGTVISAWGSLPGGSVEEMAGALGRMYRDWSRVQGILTGGDAQARSHMLAWSNGDAVLLTSLREGVLLALMLDGANNVGWARMQVERAHPDLARYLGTLMEEA